jgi:hypothetical protein
MPRSSSYLCSVQANMSMVLSPVINTAACLQPCC